MNLVTSKTLEQDLCDSITNGDKVAAQELLEMGINPVSRDPKTNESALSRAVASGDFETMWMVYSHAASGAKKGQWEAPDARGLMTQATSLGHDKVASYLSQFVPAARRHSVLSTQSWNAKLAAPQPATSNALKL